MSTTNRRELGNNKDRRAPVLKVSVPQEIIDAAQIANSGHCAGADSLKADYPKYTHVSIDLQTVRISDPTKGLRYIYLTPRVLQQAIWLFDQGKKIKPFKFSLRGAHIVSMQLTNRTKGKPHKERIKLGRRRVVPDRHNPYSVPNVVGGQGPKKQQIGPGSTLRREFGLRALSPHDLEAK